MVSPLIWRVVMLVTCVVLIATRSVISITLNCSCDKARIWVVLNELAWVVVRLGSCAVVNKDTKVVDRLGSTLVGMAAICAVVNARICGDLRLFI